MANETMKKMLEQLQAEFHQDAETLATLQNIYAEKVKQIRTNRALPPDIQQRFLTEWEQFYNQRVGAIFAYMSANGYQAEAVQHQQSEPQPVSEPDVAASSSFGIETMESRPKKGRA
jgi:hypothetical protein